MTPQEFRDKTIGKRYDFDNFPGYNPYQCIDYFNKGIIDLKIPVSILCAITGYVCDLWRLKDQYSYGQYFHYIYEPKELKNGDWCIWDRGSSHALSHIAMYFNGKELGQNQPHPYVTEKETTFDIMGALRPKNWSQPARGYAEGYNKDFAHVYGCGYPLHLRTGGETSYTSLCVMSKDSRVQCWGYYHKDKTGRIWLYVTYGNLTGFACMNYLYKIY